MSPPPQRHLQVVPDELPLVGLPEPSPAPPAPAPVSSPRPVPHAEPVAAPQTPRREHRAHVDDDVVPERRQPRVETCDHCLGDVRWFVTAAKRRWIAVDATPDPAGNLRRLSDGTMAVIPKPSQREAMRDAGVQFWMPHVATCPKAALWARQGGPTTNNRGRRRGRAPLPADRPAAVATHRCPCGCGCGVPNRFYACREGWFRLPSSIRGRITATNDHRATTSERAAALRAAADFYASEAP